MCTVHQVLLKKLLGPVTVKKGLQFSGMSLNKTTLARNSLFIPGQGEVG
jgi:hypothetical protein